MTKPRLSPTRELYGILGAHPNASSLQRDMNLYFEKNGMNAFCDRYPTNIDRLPERLSEMFHFDRRAYIVGPKLQDAIAHLLDEVDGDKPVDIVINKGGVLKGYSVGDISLKDILSLIAVS